MRGRLQLAALAVLAIAAQLAYNMAVAAVGRQLGKAWTPFTPGYDFWPIWRDTHYFLSGHGDPQWYGAGISNAWPPPHEVLLAPFALLSFDAAHVVTMVVTAGLTIAAIMLWITPSAALRSRGRETLYVMLLSAPVFSVIWIDQLQAAVGLAALSLAIWARRRERWWLVGMAGAIGMIRVLNAIPVLCILLLAGWGKWRQLGIALASACAVMAPLLFVSYLWDPHFVGDYLAGLTAYPFNGAPKAATFSFGIWGLVMLLALVCAAGLWLVRKDVGRPLDPGRAAAVMSLTVLSAPVGGLYPAIYALPVLIRLGQRPGFWLVPWLGAAVPWLVILLLSPWLLGPSPGMALNSLSFLDYALVLLAYPILRRPPDSVDLKRAA